MTANILKGKRKTGGTTQESQRLEMAGVMARWREEVRNIQLEHQQEHRDLEEVQNDSRTRKCL
jgi:hypothetical protein